MNQFVIFTGVEANNCNVDMVKIVMGGTRLEENRYGSSLKSKGL